MRRVALVLFVFGSIACSRTVAAPPPTEPALPHETARAPEPAPRVQSSTPAAEPTPPATATATATATAPADPHAPLTEEQRAVLSSIPHDEVPEHRGGVTPERENKHYVAGNEKTLDAFYKAVAGVGGGYVGVGSDQAYLFIAWVKPEIAWLTDYDPDVVDVHEVYRLIILASDTPEAMLALWDKGARERVDALVDAEHEGRHARRLKGLYARNRGWIARRLVSQRAHFKLSEVPTWLTDQGSYDFVKRLLQAGRVKPVLANLLDARGVKGVAESAKALGVPVRVLYLSNAEEYWPRYTQRFRDNLASLPFSDDAVVLRTLLIWEINEDYRYNVQRAANYLAWLARPFVRTVYDVTHARPKASREGINLFETDGDPDDSPAARRHEKAAASASPRRT